MIPDPNRKSKRARLIDVAEHANVSVGTVSNVLNRPGRVAAPIRLKVESAIQHLRFEPNGLARQLRAGSGRSIGLLVLDYENPFFTEVAGAVEDRATEAGYLVILCNSRHLKEREDRYLRMLDVQRVSGVLVTPLDETIPDLHELRARGMNVVLLAYASPDKAMCSVSVDDLKGGALAAGHLLELGHRRIGFVGGPHSIRQRHERYEGMRSGIASAGLAPDEVLHDIDMPQNNPVAGEASVDRIIANKLTAVFCMNDFLALGVLRRLGQLGIRVPEDVSVVGYDDVRFAELLSPALTSIRQPKLLLGRAAAELLIEEAERPTHEHRQILFAPELVVRESTAVVANSGG